MDKFIAQDFTFKTAYESDKLFQQYQPNGLSLFALTLYLSIEDITEFAANAITDGRNDKKIDFCFLDENEKRLIVAQGYESDNWGKASAPANKASDLNTAISWLLSANEKIIPTNLATKAKEVRNALNSGDIKRGVTPVKRGVAET